LLINKSLDDFTRDAINDANCKLIAVLRINATDLSANGESQKLTIWAKCQIFKAIFFDLRVQCAGCSHKYCAYH